MRSYISCAVVLEPYQINLQAVVRFVHELREIEQRLEDLGGDGARFQSQLQ